MNKIIPKLRGRRGLRGRTATRTGAAGRPEHDAAVDDERNH